MSCGVGCRCSSDPAWLWLWHRLVATAPIQPLTWEHPYTVGAALKRQKQKKNPQNTVQKDLMPTTALTCGPRGVILQSPRLRSCSKWTAALEAVPRGLWTDSNQSRGERQRWPCSGSAHFLGCPGGDGVCAEGSLRSPNVYT